MRTRQLLVSQDTETDDRVDREVCRRVNARSMVVVPLRHRDRSQGVLKVVSADPHAFSAADVRLLEQLAEFIASALSRATVIDDPLRDARVDSLTGLANRAAFLGQLDAAISAAAVQHRIAAVLYLDLDGFKPINDTHGHAVGDEVLREVGARIARLCGESDLPARIVGDVAIVSGGDLAEAVLARADASMYSDKRGKRQVGDVPAEVTEVITAMIAVRRGPDVESAVRCEEKSQGCCTNRARATPAVGDVPRPTSCRLRGRGRPRCHRRRRRTHAQSRRQGAARNRRAPKSSRLRRGTGNHW